MDDYDKKPVAGVKCWFAGCPFTYRKNERSRFETHLAREHGIKQGVSRTARPRRRRKIRTSAIGIDVRQLNFLGMVPSKHEQD